MRTDPQDVQTAELHVHLNGAIPMRTPLEPGRRHRVQMPADSVEGLRGALRFRDFAHFRHWFDAACITPCRSGGGSLLKSSQAGLRP